MKAISRNLLLLFALTVFSSHELFLKSDSHFLEPNTVYELYLLNGTFDKSENAITTDRIIDPKIIGPDYRFSPKEGDYHLKENKTYLRFATQDAGTYISGISTLPRVLEMTGQAFAEYLEHEGLEKTLTARREAGVMDSSAKEKYSKHVKALLQVGDKTTDEYRTELGYPIEFIPLNNPFENEVDGLISFRLLRNGKPLPNQTVHYSTSVPGVDAHENENSTTTNDKGICAIRPNKPGKWYVATIHMEESKEEGLDYESNWATLTFEVK